LRNGFYRNGVDNLLVEMGKWDLGLEDLLMVVNFFSKVTVDDNGLSASTAAIRRPELRRTVCADGRPGGADRAAASDGSCHRVCAAPGCS
jgi:hypothetical protein